MKINSPMNKKDWDETAEQYLKNRQKVEKIENWYTYYVGQAYFKASQKGLKYLKGKRKINLLKTDLWEEVVETGRSIFEKLSQIKKKRISLYAVDLSTVLVEKAKKITKEVNIQQGDIRNLPFKNDFFDIILDLSTLDHVPTKDHKQVFVEYQRVLKKGGVLVLVFLRKSPVLSLINFRAKIRGKKPLVDDQSCFASAENETKEKLKNLFDLKEEYCLGSILLMSLLTRGVRPIINRSPYTLLNWILKLEYSRFSKLFLKTFADLYLIIGIKK